MPVTDPRASAEFYARFAQMRIVHERREVGGVEVLWISDLTRPFVIVLLPVEEVTDRIDHLGVGCASRDEVDRRLADARALGLVVDGPNDSPPPVGYWGTIQDPDGHLLELAFGQEVGLTVGGVRD
jgi:catechol 2,3-dioxygenase-like lactoylglutathione lyase family enzyme